jgi:TRAP-type C4-dicarboxylate transport system substrate-binding protein
MKRISLILVVVMMMVVPLTGFSKEGDKPIKLTYASYLKEDFTNNLTTKWWMDEVTKRTHGRVTFEKFYSGMLLKGEELLPGCGRGQADLVLAPDSYTAGLTPLSMVQILSFMTDKMDSYMGALWELFTTEPLLLEEFKKNNVYLLAEIPVSSVLVGSKANLNSMDKLKGKRIRCMTTIAQLMKEVNAVPVALPLTDVYDAISKGLIDAYSHTEFTLATLFKLYEVAPYMIDTGIGMFGGMWFAINGDKWNKLGGDIKNVMIDVSKGAIDRHVALYSEIEAKKVDEAHKGGAKCVIWTDVEKARFKNAAAHKVWNSWINEMNSKGLKGTEVFNRWKALVEKHNAQSKYITPYKLFEKKYGVLH